MCIPDALLIFVAILGSVLAFFCILLNLYPYSSTGKKSWTSGFFFYVAVPVIAIIYWLSLYAHVPWAYKTVQTYPVETVNYNDGSQVQIISLDAVNKFNVTEQFKRTLPPGSTITRKTRQTVYLGIYDVDCSSELGKYEYTINLPTGTPTTQPASAK